MLGLLAYVDVGPEVHGGVARPGTEEAASLPAAGGEALLARVPDPGGTSAPSRLAIEPALGGARPALRPALQLAMGQWTLHGRVVDLDGRGMGGHRVGVGADKPLSRTSADGSFEFHAPALSARPWSCEPGFVTVAATRATRDRPSTVVVAPSQPLRVRVTSQDSGEPIRAARIQPIMGPTLLRRLKGESQALVLTALSSDRAGEVQFASLPEREWVQFHVSRPGYRDAVLSASVDGLNGASIALAPIAVKRWISGRVASAAGEPVGGAQVRVGGSTCRSRRDGNFRLGVVDDSPGFIDVYHPSLGSARLPLPSGPEASADSRLDLTLVPADGSTYARRPKSQQPVEKDAEGTTHRHPMTGLIR